MSVFFALVSQSTRRASSVRVGGPTEAARARAGDHHCPWSTTSATSIVLLAALKPSASRIVTEASGAASLVVGAAAQPAEPARRAAASAVFHRGRRARLGDALLERRERRLFKVRLRPRDRLRRGARTGSSSAAPNRRPGCGGRRAGRKSLSTL